MSKIDTLEPAFKAQVAALIEALTPLTGHEWRITSARRTMAEQQALYDQGRTKPGPVVTKAPPGSSAHNFGLAVDLVPMKDGKPWWEAPKSLWKKMADEAKRRGMVSGYYFKTIFDAPHVEDANWRAVKTAWKEGKIHVA